MRTSPSEDRSRQLFWIITMLLHSPVEITGRRPMNSQYCIEEGCSGVPIDSDEGRAALKEAQHD